MSKGANIFNHFNPPKSDGHRVIEVDGPTVYCPKVMDNVTGTYTSAGIKCTCGKMF